MAYIKNWFSNMLPCDHPIVDEMGVAYNTVEAYFQGAKFADISERRKVAGLNPCDAKRQGRTALLPADWGTRKFKVMEDALRQKFAPGTTWHTKLMATGDEDIVEWNNWHDHIWGRDPVTLVGKNHLGCLLMKLRVEWKSRV